MLKKIIFSLILFIAPLFSPVFMANAAELTKNCYSLTLSLIDESVITAVYSNTTNWYSDSSCTKQTTLTIPRRASDNALPVFFNTKCEAEETTHSATGTVSYPTTLGATCTYSASDGLVCNITADKITSNTSYCADTFASPTNLTSISAGRSSASLTYSASSGTCYAVTLNANGGTNGSPTTLYKKSGSTTWYSEKTCTTIVNNLTSIASKSGHSFNGYYTAASGGTQCITSSGTLSTSTSCNVTAATTLYAQYTARCNTITLNANGGNTASVSVLYKKTDATGWFTDSSCTTSYATTTNIVPTRSGYTFRGYFSTDLEDATSNASNGTLYIQYTGASTLAGGSWTPTTNTTIYAAWAKDCTIPENGECKLEITTATGAATYNTSCNSGYAISNGGTANPTCTSGFWNGGGGGSCGDVVNINFWGLSSNGSLVNLTGIAKPTFTNSSGQWKTSGGTVVTTFKSLGVSVPTISSSITVDGTTYAKGIKPYRAQWVGGTPTDIPDGMVATSSVCSTNMDTSRDIALDGSLPNITDAIENYATEANYIILYAANCIDPTGATLGSTCSLSTANGGATYSNTCLPGTGNPTFWQAAQTCLDYDVHEMEQGACAL